MDLQIRMKYNLVLVCLSLLEFEQISMFEEDFLVEEESLFAYIKQYLNEQDRLFVEQNPVKLKKMKYDWNLNKQ